MEINIVTSMSDTIVLPPNSTGLFFNGKLQDKYFLAEEVVEIHKIILKIGLLEFR